MESQEQKRTVELRYRYQIPSKLQVEDQVVSLGPFHLTLRQTLILIAGGCISLDIWRALAIAPMILRLPASALPVVIAFFWGIVKIGGRYTEVWLFILWLYANTPKIYSWQHVPDTQERAHENASGASRERAVLDEESE